MTIRLPGIEKKKNPFISNNGVFSPDSLSGLNSCLITVKQTANMHLTVKLEYHFQSVGCTKKARVLEAVHKNQSELVRTKI